MHVNAILIYFDFDDLSCFYMFLFLLFFHYCFPGLLEKCSICPELPLLDGVNVPGIRISSCFFARTEPLGVHKHMDWSYDSPATGAPRFGSSSWMCKKPLTWLLLSERPRRKKRPRRKDWL